MSGADLEYARLLHEAGLVNGVSMDGARLEQLGDIKAAASIDNYTALELAEIFSTPADPAYNRLFNSPVGINIQDLYDIVDSGRLAQNDLDVVYLDGVRVKSKGAVGNGIANDTQPFLDSIAAAVVFGVPVILDDAVYAIDPITILDDNVSIIGQGDAKVISRTAHVDGIIKVTGNNVTLCGFTIDGVFVGSEGQSQFGLRIGDGTQTTGLNVTLDKIKITNSYAHGVYANQCPNLTIKNCHFFSCGGATGVTGSGLFASSCTNLIIRDSIFEDAWEHGCYVLGGNTFGLTFTGNYALDNGVRGPGGGVGFSIRSQRCTFIGNYSFGNDAGALMLSAPIQSPSTAGSYATLTGNILGWSVGVVDREVHITGIDYSVVSANVMQSTISGYTLRVGATVGGVGCNVSGNVIVQDFASLTGGVFVERENVKMVGNLIKGPGSGGSGVTLKENIAGVDVQCNTITGFTTGINLLTGTSYVNILVINNNVLTGSALSNGATGTNINCNYYHSTDGLRIDGGFRHLGTKLGFFGVSAIVRPSALTQTYATADATLGAYTADAEASVYTGAADSEAKLSDLNALREAYENLRLHHEDLAQFTNSVVDKLQSLGLLQ